MKARYTDIKRFSSDDKWKSAELRSQYVKQLVVARQEAEIKGMKKKKKNERSR